jgi:hypothetical protein
MPPWLDWLDWLKWDSIGAGALGKILGVWLGFFVSLVGKIVRITLITSRIPAFWTSETRISPLHQLPETGRSSAKKLLKMAISTLLTLATWLVITWKPVWSAAGAEGDRLLTVALILTSAAWPISLLWILFSKPRHPNVTRTPQLGIEPRKSNMSHPQI